jgi:putative ABC transport system permease protein
MAGWLQDLKVGARALRSARGFSVVAILALALGIGATSAIFTLLYRVMIRPLPYPEPDRIVTSISVQEIRGIRDGGVSFADYQDWRQQADLFQYSALWRSTSLDLTGGDRPERVTALTVTGEFFHVLGSQPVLGRTFGPEADVDGDRPVVITDGTWQRLFGGDRGVIGRAIHLSGVPHILVGVIPTNLAWPERTDVFVPLRLNPASNPSLLRRDNFIFRSIARLPANVSLEQANARVATLARGVEQQFTASRKGWSYAVVGLHDYTVGEEFRGALLILGAAVGLVLLIACANVANLLLARGADRRRELAVRAALGASRGRIRQALLAESTLLASVGGVLGLALANWLSRALVTIAPAETPLLAVPRLDWPMVGFTFGVALATALLFGLLPAWQDATVSPGDALKDGGRTGAGRRAGHVRDILVVSEMALAVVLLVASAMTIRSLVAIGRVDPGVDVKHVLGARLILPGPRYPQPVHRAQFFDQLVERVRSLPGVSNASITSRLPAGGPGAGLGRVFLAEGQAEPPATTDVPAQWTVVGPDYFATVGTPIVKGRTFTPQDNSRSQPVIVVGERFASQMFPGQDPIGRKIRSWRDENVLREIVGVVGDVKYMGLADRPRNAVYVPHAQDSWGTMILSAKSEGDPLALVNAIRQEVTALDPMLALGNVDSLANFSAESISGNRFTARLLGAFAALALVLAAIGVYGVMAYAVSRRSQEIGVRVALGATQRDVALLVIGRGLLLAVIGLIVGGTAAGLSARTVRAMLPEIDPLDPLSFAVSAGILLVVALAACGIPALRASRLDPSTVLRQG